MEIYSPVGEHDRPDGAVLPPELRPLCPRAGFKALVQGAGGQDTPVLVAQQFPTGHDVSNTWII